MKGELIEMRKNQYRFVMVYCKLKNNGYGICDTMADCRKCETAKDVKAL